jgi:hypothetical protein
MAGTSAYVLRSPHPRTETRHLSLTLVRSLVSLARLKPNPSVARITLQTLRLCNRMMNPMFNSTKPISGSQGLSSDVSASPPDHSRMFTARRTSVYCCDAVHALQLKSNTKAKTPVVKTLNRFGVGLLLVIVLRFSDHGYREMLSYDEVCCWSPRMSKRPF